MNAVPAVQGGSTVVMAAVLAILLTLVAYGIGVIPEYLGVITFEWLLERIKVKRIKTFFQVNGICCKATQFCDRI